MMLRTFKPFQASTTIRFKDPDTGRVIHADTLIDLYREIISYRHQNQLEDIEELPAVVENYLCSLPENANRCKSVELKRSWSTYLKGGVQLVKNMAFKVFCSQEEADIRAAQCVACPHNIFPDKGPFMAWADDYADKQVGERRAALHNELGSCACCTCPLRGKVFVGGSIKPFPEDQLVKMKGVKCWQLKLSGQDGP